MLGRMANEHATTKHATTIERVLPAVTPFLSFLHDSPYARRRGLPNVADFTFGNPQEMPLPGYVSALGRNIEPRDKDWFAYKLSEPSSTQTVADVLRRRTGLDFETSDVFMTNGAFAGINVVLKAICDPGDEVIFLSPPWFFYEALIVSVGAVAVRVALEPPAFDLPIDAIISAVTERTRAVIVNSPHNPTGRIYPLADLKRLGDALSEASKRIGHPVRILSDEAYNRIIFDGRAYHSPAEVYPETFVVYTYGKTLLAPGERVGYVAVPPTMADRERVRRAVSLAQWMTGFAYPNATLQRSLAELEELSIDIPAMQRRRDRMASALREMGYELLVPEGTFYMMVRAPIDDDNAFAAALAEHNTFVLPGSVVERPGWFRVSLTASDEMVERGLPGFEAAMRAAREPPR